MGTWKGTCGLSQLPIRNGEKVVLFPLLQIHPTSQSLGSGFSYANYFFEPITLPLFGEYNDLGGMRNIHGMTDVVLNHFKHLETWFKSAHSALRYASPDTLQRIPLEGKIKDYATLDELINEFIAQRRIGDVSFMLVAEDIYRRVMNEMSSRPIYGETYGIQENYKRMAQDFIASQKEYLPIVQKTIQKEVSEELFKDILFDLMKDHPFVNKLSAISPRFMLLLRMYFHTPNEELLNSLADFVAFSQGMELARKTWMPQAGAGDDRNEYRLQGVIAERILWKEQQIREEYLEDSEDVPDDLTKG